MTRRRLFHRFGSLLVGAAWFGRTRPVPASAAPPDLIAEGTSAFPWADDKGYPGKTLTVHYFLPPGVPLRSAPILFVMHGTLRNGAEYRDQWKALAAERQVLLLVPEFGKDAFPSGMYNRGNVRGENDDQPQPQSKWTFTAIERLFDYVKGQTGNTSARYHIYGHSAGGQFVHRLVLTLPNARYARAVAANSGYYTLPFVESDAAAADPYPFSLKNTPISDDNLSKSLGRDMVVLLGENDTDANDPDLYHGPEADKQGLFRFARGQFFLAAARAAAEKRAVALGWRIVTVPGVGHSNEKMAPAAARVLFASKKTANDEIEKRL